jgi:hypothetical protein
MAAALSVDVTYHAGDASTCPRIETSMRSFWSE